MQTIKHPCPASSTRLAPVHRVGWHDGADRDGGAISHEDVVCAHSRLCIISIGWVQYVLYANCVLHCIGGCRYIWHQNQDEEKKGLIMTPCLALKIQGLWRVVRVCRVEGCQADKQVRTRAGAGKIENPGKTGSAAECQCTEAWNQKYGEVVPERASDTAAVCGVLVLCTCVVYLYGALVSQSGKFDVL